MFRQWISLAGALSLGSIVAFMIYEDNREEVGLLKPNLLSPTSPLSSLEYSALLTVPTVFVEGASEGFDAYGRRINQCDTTEEEMSTSISSRDVAKLIQELGGVVDPTIQTWLVEKGWDDNFICFRLSDGRMIFVNSFSKQGELYRDSSSLLKQLNRDYKGYLETKRLSALADELRAQGKHGDSTELNSSPEYSLLEDEDFPNKVEVLIEGLRSHLGLPESALDRSIASVRVIDLAIEHTIGEEQALQEIFPNIVAYLGEVIRIRANGRWVMQKRSMLGALYPCIISSSGNAYDPARYAYRALSDSEEDFDLHDAVEMEIADILWPKFFSE